MILLHSIFIVITYIVSRLTSGECLQLTRVDIESPIIAGEGGWLRCDWDEEGDSIYAVKWYWGRDEFYRWTPKADNPVLVFEVDAFDVDQMKSSKGHVFIKDVSLKAAGILRCEVSGEGPTFHTDYKEKKLAVVDLPDTQPRITGSRQVYQAHQHVVLTCTSPGSKPAASLAFYINGEKANDSYLTHHKPRVDHISGLETAVLGIRFPLLPRLLHRGKAVVKCAATLMDLYWESNEQIIKVDVPLRAPRMEERASSSAAGVAPSSGGITSRGIGKNFALLVSVMVVGIGRLL